MADQAEHPPAHGKTLHTWAFPEFTAHKRDRRWYTIAGVLAAIALLWAVYDGNVLFAIILLIAAIVYVMIGVRKPRQLTATFTEDGVSVDRAFYRWEEIDRFWLVYEPPIVKRLYLAFKAPLRPTLTIDLEQQNPVPLRKTLLTYLKEDPNGAEPLGDQVARTFKL